MVDFPGSDKTVLIKITMADDKAWIAVQDSGCGVQAKERERLFEAFFTTKQTGLGMGLAISQGIVEDHGGKLRYQPKESGGSIFIIEIPICSG